MHHDSGLWLPFLDCFSQHVTCLIHAKVLAFAGALPRAIWIAPLGAMNFAGYELAKNALNQSADKEVGSLKPDEETDLGMEDLQEDELGFTDFEPSQDIAKDLETDLGRLEIQAASSGSTKPTVGTQSLVNASGGQSKEKENGGNSNKSPLGNGKIGLEDKATAENTKSKEGLSARDTNETKGFNNGIEIPRADDVSPEVPQGKSELSNSARSSGDFPNK